MKHFHGADPADPRLCHLVIDTSLCPAPARVRHRLVVDTTRPPVPATVEPIVVAARALRAAGRDRAAAPDAPSPGEWRARMWTNPYK